MTGIGLGRYLDVFSGRHRVRWPRRCCLVLVTLQCLQQSFAATDHPEVRIANTKEVESLDPVLVDGTNATLVARALFEGLAVRDPRTAQAVPGAAERWEISEKGTLYRFYLRPGLRWSDGAQMVAEDFVKAWRRAIMPASRAAYGSLYDVIEGGRALRLGKSKDPSTLGVRAVNSRELHVRLNRPEPDFPEYLTEPVFFPVRTDVLEGNPVGWDRPGKLIGNGPFFLRDWQLNRHLLVAKNRYYWQATRVLTPQIRFLPVPDPKTALQMYETGEVDWVRVTPRSAFKRLAKRRDFHVDPLAGTVYLRLNTTLKPLDDARVRRAVSMALDRPLIATRFAREGQKPASRFVSPLIPDYPEEPLVGQNVASAKQLLAEAGFPDGKGFPPLNLIYISDPQAKSVTLAISTLLKRHLNIAVSPRNMERGSYYDRLDSLGFHLARSSWRAKYLGAMSFLEKFTSSNPWQNLTGYNDPTYDKLIARARSEESRGARSRYLADAERLLVEKHAAIIPLYHSVATHLRRQDLKGFHATPLDSQVLTYVYRARRVAVGKEP